MDSGVGVFALRHLAYSHLPLKGNKMREAIRYLNNAKEILAKAPIEDNEYTDVKPVREAFGTMYLAILEAINEALTEKEFTKKELPKSVDEYRRVLQKPGRLG
mgnify:CR=1 FL=1